MHFNWLRNTRNTALFKINKTLDHFESTCLVYFRTYVISMGEIFVLSSDHTHLEISISHGLLSFGSDMVGLALAERCLNE